MKILLFGATGMLGQDLVKIISNEHLLLKPTRYECNLEDRHSIENYLKNVKTDFIVNCGAYTNVDKCHDEQASALAINALAPKTIAHYAYTSKIPLIHISSDYVFDGKKDFYTIDDIPNKTLNSYGESKLFGEIFIKKNTDKYFIVRTSWLYGHNGKNFVDTILNLAKKDGPLRVVNDQFGCPTSTVDLASAILGLLNYSQYGIHHASGEGSCSWYEFAQKVLEIKNIKKEIIPISTEESFKLFPHIKAIRPKKSILRNTLLMRKWEDALAEYLK